MLRALQRNVFQFSAAKTRSEIVALSSAMLDDSGKLQTFAAFRRKAVDITGEFTGPWLRAEYNNAIAASQMAGRWVEHEQGGDQTLVYKTVRDARVREEHRMLEGIARPMSDAFWRTYYPPNGWGCRCDVQASTVPGSRGTIPAGAIDGVPELFRVNMAQEGLAFPKDHPYYKFV